MQTHLQRKGIYIKYKRVYCLGRNAGLALRKKAYHKKKCEKRNIVPKALMTPNAQGNGFRQ